MCLFKQKTEYEMRISDWSSDVCSSDLEDGQWLTTSSTNDNRSAHALRIWSAALHESLNFSRRALTGSSSSISASVPVWKLGLADVQRRSRQKSRRARARSSGTTPKRAPA